MKTEEVTIFEVLQVRPMTMKEINIETGILRENICRRIADLEEAGKVAFIKKRRCTITGFTGVKEYTADPLLFPSTNQLNLF